jgi:hypothetical protein
VFQFSLDGIMLHTKLIVANLEDVRMAHIHVSAEPGGNGPPSLRVTPRPRRACSPTSSFDASATRRRPRVRLPQSRSETPLCRPEWVIARATAF